MSQNHTTEELEDLYAQLLARSPALAWIKDAQHRLIFINPAFGEAFNIDRDAWLGKSVWDLFPEEQARAIAANDTRIQNADETESVVETVTYGGRSYHYLSYKYPLPQPDEKRFLGGVSVDITREVEAERALTQAVTRLQQEATLRDRLLGLFSHDVRGPLVNIVETVRGLTDDDDPIEMEDLKILLPMIQEQASETLELISEVLSWVRMNLNATHLPQRVLPLLPRVQQICQRLDGHARARQVRFALEDLEQARVQSNGGLVERVLTNVLSNALKYSPPGGIVAVSAAARDGAVEVYVDDDGPGIPDEAIVLLEGGECQTPRRGASGEIGRGIGLALCQDLMRRNG
ncbi:MAG: PAS domain-containing sensor histidine kinase, partial [Myxococcota bacterium]